MASGKVYIVATPIGNLSDITFRAVDILKTVDLIVCESVSHSHPLFLKYGIETKRTLLKEDQLSIDKLLNKILSGQNVAVISDAGTPGLSDPGAIIVRACIKSDINVVPIPGPSSCTASLSAAGILGSEFYFAGFVPQKTKREKFFTRLANFDVPIIFFESPKRIISSLEDLSKAYGLNHEIVVCRELTKLFEEIKSQRIVDHISFLKDRNVVGEFVVIVPEKKSEKFEDEAKSFLSNFQSILFDRKLSDAAKDLAKVLNGKLPRGDAYDVLTRIRKK